jgi:WD40 repeat protein
MKRLYLSYTSGDRDTALYIANQLRAEGYDVFYDRDRLVEAGTFTRRLEKEILSRGCLLLIQTPEGLSSPLVQAELEFAYLNKIEIIPLAFKMLNVRETGEFRFLLNMRPIDFGGERQSPVAIERLYERLRRQNSGEMINVNNVSSLKPWATLQGHTSWIRHVTFSPDNRLLASCANDNAISIWDIRATNRSGDAPTLLTRITAHDRLVWSLDFAPRHALLASAASDNTVRLWDLNSLPTPYEFARFNDHRQAVHDVCFSTDGQLMATASYDSYVIVRDVRNVDVTGAARKSVALDHISHVYSVAFSPDSAYLASGSRDSVVRLWKLDSMSIDSLNRLKPNYLRGHSTWVNKVVFSPNSQILASAGDDSTIRLWDVREGDALQVLTGHKDSVNSIAFSPDGSVLASAAKDHTVRLWDMNTLREMAVIRAHERGVNSVAFSPDGTKLVTGSGDHTIKIWTVVEKFP